MVSNNKILEYDDRGFICIEGMGWEQSTENKIYLEKINKQYSELISSENNLLLNKFLDKHNIYN